MPRLCLIFARPHHPPRPRVPSTTVVTLCREGSPILAKSSQPDVHIVLKKFALEVTASRLETALPPAAVLSSPDARLSASPLGIRVGATDDDKAGDIRVGATDDDNAGDCVPMPLFDF